ncbi:MAG: tRNA (N(6)-L-threonylcarbamoyladenosine(37)-C(2))-methylthiotransferase MtaB [Clostridiales bacterium]|nr:tRNA (N(6)-L-threonylcarbamoyladenosine(37)-C(2))-methylthiotransferase MtaB [Clostridiales bacterium]
MKICVFTLGCKVNFYESEGLITELTNIGYECTNKLEYADIYILNTCAVTNEGERKSRQLVTKVRQLNQNAKIIICGCASQKNSKQFEDLNVNIVVGNGYKKEILNLLNKEKYIETKILPKEYTEEFLASPQRVRAYLKVQDGCNNFCSYCIIPFLRGRSRSRNLENIINEAKILSKMCGEIVLTGINLSDYKPSLIELIESLKNINSRIRLGSLEVNVITEKFLNRLKKIENFCPHFHLSLQSGCTEILQKMNRHYTKEEYLQKVELIKKYFPFASITTDLIVGFPTETEDNFKESLDTLDKAEFMNVHCFPYSMRDGTKASKMVQILNSVKHERVKEVQQLTSKLFDKYINKLKNDNVTQNLLIEEVVFIDNEKYFVGHTEYFVKCYLKYCDLLKENDIIKVNIKEKFKDGVLV